MALRIHHLNCGTMCPHSARLINGQAGWLHPAEMVCHCLLIETAAGLVLVDTGIGSQDIRRPEQLGRAFLQGTRPRLDHQETALAQIQALGFTPRDVRHIIVTHLDLDHAGGLPDFPEAAVHVFAPELAAAMNPTWRERHRYLRTQFAHGPNWVPHHLEGERWFGFEAVRALPGVMEEVLLVPLLGHTRGHAGVAVRDATGWRLHCGDAYFYHGLMDIDRPHTTPGLALVERLTQTNARMRLHNQARLRQLLRHHGEEVRVFCAHDPVELARMRG